MGGRYCAINSPRGSRWEQKIPRPKVEGCLLPPRYEFRYYHIRPIVSRGAAYVVGFDHGLPCRVKNMARGTQ